MDCVFLVENKLMQLLDHFHPPLSLFSSRLIAFFSRLIAFESVPPRSPNGAACPSPKPMYRQSKSLFRPAHWPHATASGHPSLAAMAVAPARSAAWTGRSASVRVTSQLSPHARATRQPVLESWGGGSQTGLQRRKGVRHHSAACTSPTGPRAMS